MQTERLGRPRNIPSSASVASIAVRAPEVVPCTKVRDYPAPGPHVIQRRAKTELAYIDILANPQMRLDGVKRTTQIQNTSYSFAATKDFRVAAREHTLAPPGRHRPRRSRIRLTACQSTPAIDAAFYRSIGTLYQLQPSFHPQSAEPEPTARARRAGKEFY